MINGLYWRWKVANICGMVFAWLCFQLTFRAEVNSVYSDSQSQFLLNVFTACVVSSTPIINQEIFFRYLQRKCGDVPLKMWKIRFCGMLCHSRHLIFWYNDGKKEACSNFIDEDTCTLCILCRVIKANISTAYTWMEVIGFGYSLNVYDSLHLLAFPHHQVRKSTQRYNVHGLLSRQCVCVLE